MKEERRTTVESFMSKAFSCRKVIGYVTMQSRIETSHIPLRVISSSDSLEANSDSNLAGKEKLLIDCGPEQECVLGGIVALGKFDALHIGHRELAIQASRTGVPFLLSFIGMAEVLGWQYRPPIVAKSDRKRVLSSWAPYCGNVTPQEYQVQFSAVRYLSPRQFVERLSKELRVSGVVAGENYRFGYKASGDAAELVKLCKEYGLESYIVSPVMDESQRYFNGASSDTNKREKVSSTRIRYALSLGDMEYVQQLLGRKHRLVLAVDQERVFLGNRLSIPKLSALNLPPKEGFFNNCSLLIGDKYGCPCTVLHDSRHIHVEVDGSVSSLLGELLEPKLISIEFG